MPDFVSDIVDGIIACGLLILELALVIAAVMMVIRVSDILGYNGPEYIPVLIGCVVVYYGWKGARSLVKSKWPHHE